MDDYLKKMKDDHAKQMKRINTIGTGSIMAVCLAGAAYIGWMGIHERLSLPDFQKNEAQYLVSHRSAARDACLQEQFQSVQSAVNSRSASGGAFSIAFDPNSSAMQSCTDKTVKADFDSAVSSKKNAPYTDEPFAAVYLAVAAVLFWNERRQKNPQPRPGPSIQFPPPPRPAPPLPPPPLSR